MSYRTTPTPHPLVFVHGGRAVAMDAETGQTRWQVSTVQNIVRMAFMADRVFLLDRDCGVHCIDAATGRVLGQIQAMPESKHGAAMIADGNRLFVATTGGVVCISSEGQLLWKNEQPGGGWSILPGIGILGQIAQPDFNQG